MGNTTPSSARRPTVRFVETPEFRRDADTLFSEDELQSLRVRLALDPWAGFDGPLGDGPSLVWGKGDRALLVRYLLHIYEGTVIIFLTSVHRPGPDGGGGKEASVSPAFWKKVREYGIVLTLKKVADFVIDRIKEVLAGG